MTQDEAIAWLATVFEEPPANLRPETPRDEVRGWDSMGVLTLMADMDEKFNIRMSEDDVTGMTCVSDLLRFLERNKIIA